MPYEEHPACKTPSDKTQRIWRYMDFTKLIDMLEHHSLYFANIADLTDPFEGFLTSPTVGQFRSVPEGIAPDQVMRRKQVGEYNLAFMKWGRQLLNVSCWHMNEYESAAMWKIYLKSNEGVAVQSTVGKLIESLHNSPQHVCIGAITYVDYETDSIPWENIFSPAMHKRRSFEHEKELRAIIMDGTNDSGVSVPVDVDVLIEKIYLVPTTPKWIHELVGKVITKYGINKEVIRSGLEQNPLY